MDAIVTFRTQSGGWKAVQCDARILKTAHDPKDSGRGDSSVEAHADLLDRLAKQPAPKS